MRKGSKWTEEQRSKIQPHIKSGWKHTEETRQKQSQAAKGRQKSEKAKENMRRAWEKRRQNKEFMDKLRERMRNLRPPKECYRAHGDNMKGEKNPAKREEVKKKLSQKRKERIQEYGQRTDQKMRFTSEMVRWRMSVLVRDNFKCQICGSRPSTHLLVADHIKPYCRFPDLILSLENGRTLCRSCHIKTPTYGIKALTANLEKDTLDG